MGPRLLKIITVLRSGGGYRPEHVMRLRAQIPREIPLWCLTDMDVPDDVRRIPLRHGWPGWWSKIELFRPDLAITQGPTIYLDLDTDVPGDLRKLAMPTFGMIRDFYYPERFGSGVMAWRDHIPEGIYQPFREDPEGHMHRCRTKGMWGDQGFIQKHVEGPITAFPEGQVVSYKVHCRKGVPPGAIVVAYHGRPKPWDLGT